MASQRTRTRRLTAWDDEVIATDTPAGSSDTQLLCQNVADPEKRGCTLIRIIIRLSVFATVPGVVSGNVRMNYGIGLSSDDAFAANALPEAGVADDFPVAGWLWRDAFVVRDETLASGIVDHQRIALDLRAMRKLDRSSIWLRVEAAALEGTSFNVFTSGLIRCLYKLA